MDSKSHKKIICKNTKIGSLVHGDYYRFTDEDKPVPLIIYFGGSVAMDDYLQRQHSKPTIIVEQFFKAWQSHNQPSVDLLILPFPPIEDGCEGTFRDDFFSALLFEILPATDNPRPPYLGVVGYSAGAALATHVAFGLAGAKRLAVIGGYGMADSGRDSSLIGGASSRSYLAVCGFDDKAYMENISFSMFLKGHDIDLEVDMRPGGHDFGDYITNGAVLDAFAFVLNEL